MIHDIAVMTKFEDHWIISILHNTFAQPELGIIPHPKPPAGLTSADKWTVIIPRLIICKMIVFIIKWLLETLCKESFDSRL